MPIKVLVIDPTIEYRKEYDRVKDRIRDKFDVILYQRPNESNTYFFKGCVFDLLVGDKKVTYLSSYLELKYVGLI